MSMVDTGTYFEWYAVIVQALLVIAALYGLRTWKNKERLVVANKLAVEFYQLHSAIKEPLAHISLIRTKLECLGKLEKPTNERVLGRLHEYKKVNESGYEEMLSDFSSSLDKARLMGAELSSATTHADCYRLPNFSKTSEAINMLIDKYNALSSLCTQLELPDSILVFGFYDLVDDKITRLSVSMKEHEDLRKAFKDNSHKMISKILR